MYDEQTITNSFLIILKKAALKIAENYSGKIKIEIIVDKRKQDTKVNITEFDFRAT